MQATLLDARAVTAFHDRLLSRWSSDDGPPPAAHAHGLWHWIERNHVCNALLWDQEDRARRTDVPDAEIVRCKRSIDRHNQQRNDAVEAIDACLLQALGDDRMNALAPLHSETPGAMVDRLSILALKLHHMAIQAGRLEAGSEHVRNCSAKHERLQRQRRDLRDCLERLLREVALGAVRFGLYRQFKMYNDPALNPFLYGSPEGARLAVH